MSHSWFRGPILGKGSFGSIFLTTLKKTKFKTFFPPVMAVKSTEFSASASLKKEKEILDNLHGCPFVLECFGEGITMGQNGDMAYNLLLEYASGGTLGDTIHKSNGRGLPKEDVRHFTKCILEGLSQIHCSGYVHCDLKPDNILLVPTEGGKLMAEISDLELGKRSRQSKSQRSVAGWRGTPFYLAQESVIEHLQESPSDIWAVGCVVLDMLMGRPAWVVKHNGSIEELLYRIGKENSFPKFPSGFGKKGKIS